MESKSNKKRDFYEILGLQKSATQQEIKAAYRRLALKWHPDKNNNSKESNEFFKILSEAYSVLFDPQRRKHYDRFGTAKEEDEDSFFFDDLYSQCFFNMSEDEFQRLIESDSEL